MGANSSLYAKEDAEYNPAEAFPTIVEQCIGDDDLHWLKTVDLQDAALEKKMNSLTLEDYYRAFKQDACRFDIHDKYFQDLAILFTHDKSREQLAEMLTSEKDAERWLMRARSVAMSTRYDVDWRGQLIFDEQEINRRKLELHERWRFARLFHWQLDAKQGDVVWNEIRVHLAEDEIEREIKLKPAPIEIVAQSTVEAVERLCVTAKDNLRIGWVQKSTAHICCGDYTNPATVRWRNEHFVSTLTDIVGAASLNAVAGERSEAALLYRPQRHIPAGGALVTRARLLLAKQPRDTVALLVPFPRQRFQGDQAQKAALATEVLRAMAGVVKTSLAIGIDVLILPSGAAAQTAEEAYTFGALWGRVLRPTRKHFKRIIIAAEPAAPGKPLPNDVFQALSAGVRSTTAPNADRKSTAPVFGVAEGAPRPAGLKDEHAVTLENDEDEDDDNDDDGDGVGNTSAATRSGAMASSAAVEALIRESAERVAAERAAKEQRQAQEAAAREQAEAAAAVRAQLEARALEAKDERARFREYLGRAMTAHQAGKFATAVELYAEGLTALGNAYKLEDDPATKEDLRLQFERYIVVAEKAKQSAKAQESNLEP